MGQARVIDPSELVGELLGVRAYFWPGGERLFQERAEARKASPCEPGVPVDLVEGLARCELDERGGERPDVGARACRCQSALSDFGRREGSAHRPTLQSALNFQSPEAEDEEVPA